MRLETPSSKLQAPGKHQVPSSKRAPIGAWDLKLPWSLDVAAWSLLNPPARQNASVLIIVLWIAFGLVSITLYFANSMSSELRASDNRVSGLSAEQAIEGAARYVNYILVNQTTNGVMPDPSTYFSEAVAIGDAHFWFIGRDTNIVVGAGQMTFGLIDESSKVNLNSASSNILTSLVSLLPNADFNIAGAIVDWRNTNGGGSSQTYYSMQAPPYECKCAPFETVDELRLVQGGDLDTLLGDDLNRNGVLDPNEQDENHNGTVDPGLLEYVTVYSREPGTYSNGLARVNISTVVGDTGPLPSLLQSMLTSSRANQILTQLGLVTVSTGGRGGGRGRGPGGGGGGGRAVVAIATFTSPLQFYRRSGMKPEEFAPIFNAIRMGEGTNYIEGRVNVNTASPTVLASLPGMSSDTAQTLVSYRQANPDKLTSIAWVVDALGQNNSTVLDSLQAGDYITTQSYQFSADIAALGPYGRGYRRTRFIFDTVDGSPKIVYRQDLSHLGWALGKGARQTWVLAKATN